MDFRQQEYLVALDEERSFLRAAEKLFVTHGTLVHFINKLEAETGLPLFIRSRSGLVPTKIGEIYIQMAHDILFVNRQAMLRLSEERTKVMGGFSVIALPSFASDEFPIIYEEFKKEYPDTDINVLMGVHNIIYDMVRDGKADIGLTAGNTEEVVEHSKNLDCKYYDQEPLLFVVPKDMPLPQQVLDDVNAPIDLHLFADQKFFIPNYYNLVRSLFNSTNFTPRSFMKTATGLSAFNFVKIGKGVGIICPSSITDRSQVHCFRLPTEYYYKYYFIFRKNSYFTNAERYFIKLQKKNFRSIHSWADPGKCIF